MINAVRATKRFVRLTRGLALLLTLTAAASAHDMWLVTDVAGANASICARIGERFPETVNSVTEDRVRQFQIRTGAGTVKLSGTFAEKQFCAPRPSDVAAGVAEMVVQPRINSIDAQRFAQFVKGEGLDHIVDMRASGQVSYLYSRYAKLVFGQPKELAAKPLGHLLEIVPEMDPSLLASGAALRVQVLFRGKPLPNAQVAAIHEGASGEAFEFPVKVRTDQNGWATLRLTRPGLWYARLIHTIPSDDPEFQWHHVFATLTFRAGASHTDHARQKPVP